MDMEAPNYNRVVGNCVRTEIEANEINLESDTYLGKAAGLASRDGCTQNDGMSNEGELHDFDMNRWNSGG